MCGIVGFISQKKWGSNRYIGKAFSDLLIIDTLRGFDSTGVVTGNDKGDVQMRKQLGGGAEFVLGHIGRNSSKMNGTRWAIGHNRAATVGDVTAELAHPFEYENVVGVHNGTVRGWKWMFADHKDKGSDSEALYGALNDIAPDDEAVIDFLGNINSGAYALAWYDKRTKEIRFARNSQRPLHFVKTDEGLLWSSEARQLRFALAGGGNKQQSQVFQLDGMKLVSIPVESGKEARVVEYTQKRYVPPARTQAPRSQRDWWDDEDEFSYGVPLPGHIGRISHGGGLGGVSPAYREAYLAPTNKVVLHGRYAFRELAEYKGIDVASAVDEAFRDRFGKLITELTAPELGDLLDQYVMKHQAKLYEKNQLPIMNVTDMFPSPDNSNMSIVTGFMQKDNDQVLNAYATLYRTSDKDFIADLEAVLCTGNMPLVQGKLQAYTVYSTGDTALKMTVTGLALIGVSNEDIDQYPEWHPELYCGNMSPDFRGGWLDTDIPGEDDEDEIEESE